MPRPRDPIVPSSRNSAPGRARWMVRFHCWVQELGVGYSFARNPWPTADISPRDEPRDGRIPVGYGLLSRLSGVMPSSEVIHGVSLSKPYGTSATVALT